MNDSCWRELDAFAQALQAESLVSADDCDAWLAELGEDATLESFAQLTVDRLGAGESEENVQALLDKIQFLAQSAIEQAAQSAEIPAAPQTVQSAQGYESLPGFDDVSSLNDEELAERMKTVLSSLRSLGCSDLHLSGGAAPFVRRKLEIERIDSRVLSAEDARRLNFALLDPEQREEFTRHHDLNFALQLGNARFRAALMDTKDGVSGSYRLIPDSISTLENLGFLPDDAAYLRRLLDYTNGLILVTGPLGAGKTTTLAAMTDILNETRRDHVISIEDPVEIIHGSKNCQITQRQIGSHTESYRRALKAALREDPDIIIVGEMRDLETIENAITASETGHLVIGTLHTGDAANTMNRLLDVFPPSQQPQIRAMTSVSLRGVICQKRIPDGLGGVVMIYEILLNSLAVSNLIGEGKSFQLTSTMAVSRKQGMCTFDQCILEKFRLGLLTRDAGIAYMRDPDVISQLNREWAISEGKKKR